MRRWWLHIITAFVLVWISGCETDRDSEHSPRSKVESSPANETDSASTTRKSPLKIGESLQITGLGDPLSRMEVVAVDPAGGAQKYHTDQNGQVVLPDSTEFIFVRSTERWIGCVRSAIKTGELEISEEAWVRVTVTLDVEPTIRKENLRPFVSIVANGTTSQRVQELETPVSRYCSTFATKFVETDTETFLVPKGDIVNVDAGATTRTSETEVAFAQQWVDEANGERMRSVFYATEDRHVRVFLGAEELPDAQTGEWPGGDFEVIGTPFVPEERR